VCTPDSRDEPVSVFGALDMRVRVHECPWQVAQHAAISLDKSISSFPDDAFKAATYHFWYETTK
jgi:hypothetical protein